MYDHYNRRIHYLRVSVTDRCNLRCTYCMPEAGIRLLRHEDILRFEEILEVIREAAALGIDKVRVTGGEPLVRKGLLSLIKEVSHMPGIIDLGLTTNGILLEEFARPLSDAGLQRINISLDTLDPSRYSLMTRGGELSRVLKGVEAARKAGLAPIKINCVVNRSSDEPDAISVKKYCAENGLEARFIHKMNLENGLYTLVENGHGGDCIHCNRLRLTADGIVKPCLFSRQGYSIRELGIRKALLTAIGEKPEKGTTNEGEGFHYIGG